jgi:hypothetical protein
VASGSGDSSQTCKFTSLANDKTYTLAVRTITAKGAASKESVTVEGQPYGAPIITDPKLEWARADDGMTLTASAAVNGNGREAKSTWTIDGGCSPKSVESDLATFICPRKTAKITAKITAINVRRPTDEDRGPTVTTASYNLPERPKVSSVEVISRFERIELDVEVSGGTNTGLKTQYLKGGIWTDTQQNKFNVEAYLSENYVAKFQVRACSDQWPAPECGPEETYDGTAYGQAPEPSCSPEGPGPEPAYFFTCTLTWTDSWDVGSYPVAKFGVVDGTNLTVTVKCAEKAEVLNMYTPDEPESWSTVLKVSGPETCPPATSTPTVTTG